MSFKDANSTFIALNNGETFTGSFENLGGQSAIIVALKTDTTGILYVDFSPDGTNVDSTLTYTIAASTNEVHRITVTRDYARIRIYNNSGSNQTYLRAQSNAGQFYPLTSNLNSTIQADADAMVSRSVLTGATDSGDYKNVKVTETNELETAIKSPLTGFGELQTAENTSFIQTSGIYEFIPPILREYTSTGGTTSVVDRMFTCQNGTSVGGCFFL